MFTLSLGILGALAAAYVLMPLRRGANVQYAAGAGSGYHEPQAELERQLRELELDRELEKVSATDYETRRSELTQQLGTRVAGALTPQRTWTDAEIEAEIQIARARRRSSQSTPANWTCAQCGRDMSAENRFCGSCGAARPASA